VGTGDVSVDRWGLTFRYYEQSGGVVVERRGIPVDAALIREPWTPVSWAELSEWADEWMHRDNQTMTRASQIRARKKSGD